MQRAVRKVQERVGCWQSYPESDADKCNAYPKPNFPQVRSCWPPYYRAHLDDGREPDFAVEKDHVHDINYENELCLHREPDYDRTGMALNKDINYDDELCLPHEPDFDQIRMDPDDNIDYKGEFFLPYDY